MRFSLEVNYGALTCRSCTIRSGAGASKAVLNDKNVNHRIRHSEKQTVFEFTEPQRIEEGHRLSLEVRG